MPTNIKLIQNILNHPIFKSWDFDTNFIGKHKEELLYGDESIKPIPAVDVLATVLSKIALEKQNENNVRNNNLGPWGVLDNFRVNYKAEKDFKLTFPIGKNSENKEIEVTVKYLTEDKFNVVIKGLIEVDVVYQEVTLQTSGQDIIINIKDDSIFKAKYYQSPEGNIRVLKGDGDVTHIVNIY